MKPVLRRQWARLGERPIALHRRAYQWLYAGLPRGTRALDGVYAVLS